MSGGATDVGLSSTSTDASPTRRLLSFPQLISLATAAVLASTGRIPTPDLAFSLLSLPYTLLLSRYAFPRASPYPPPPVFPRDCRPLRVYVSAGGVLGLLLPFLYAVHGALYGDVGAATPPLFLLVSQVIMEGVSFSCGFSLPARASVPVLFNAYRLRAIAAWVMEEAGREGPTGVKALAGRALAVANLAFWSFNLFGFLVPMYLPRALSMHYHSKEDKIKGNAER